MICKAGARPALELRARSSRQACLVGGGGPGGLARLGIRPQRVFIMDRLRMLCLQLVLIMATSGCDSPTTAIISADATALARTTCSTRALEIRGAASSWNVFKSTCGLNALSGLAVLRGGRETREEDLDWTVRSFAIEGGRFGWP